MMQQALWVNWQSSLHPSTDCSAGNPECTPQHHESRNCMIIQGIWFCRVLATLSSRAPITASLVGRYVPSAHGKAGDCP